MCGGSSPLHGAAAKATTIGASGTQVYLVARPASRPTNGVISAYSLTNGHVSVVTGRADLARLAPVSARDT